MNVKRAIDIFSPQVTSALRYLHQYGPRFGIAGFQDCLPTVSFMEMVFKWFTIHNIRNTTFHVVTRDPTRMPFSSSTDAFQLDWLEKEFVNDFTNWRKVAPDKSAFITEETYEALVVTSISTAKCTRQLLSDGHKYVLTAKFSSDSVEALLSTIRQVNGANDQTNAYSALSALKKILTMGILHSSASSNTGPDVFPLGSSRSETRTTNRENDGRGTACADLHQALAMYLPVLEAPPVAPEPGIKATTIILIAGYLVRAVSDNIACHKCIQQMEAPRTQSPTTSIIWNLDRGGLSYPNLQFVGFVGTLILVAEKVAAKMLLTKQPQKQFVNALVPVVGNNPLFIHSGGSKEHTEALVRLTLRKFTRPFLTNETRRLSEANEKVKNLAKKPQSRKVLKV
ncbi:uncharacterized protein LOC135384276 [Ornithodoros turicata]|uniref:uncharacterized protein LOC135384276 n=1 Tax=Ornithodoros turicata TaxID=34597 RepID=UPI00313A3B7B